MPYDQAYILHRFKSLLTSRLDDPIAKQTTEIRMKHTSPGGVHISAIERSYGELIKGHADAAIESLVREFILYCKQEEADPAEHIADVQEPMDGFLDAFMKKYGASGSTTIESYLRPFRDASASVYASAKTGRLHGEQIYRYRPAWQKILIELYPIIAGTISGGLSGYLGGLLAGK